MTPNQAAKHFVMWRGIAVAEYDYTVETAEFNWDEFTERELAEFDTALARQVERVRAFFNM